MTKAKTLLSGFVLAAGFATVGAVPAAADHSMGADAQAKAAATVYFVNLKDGDTVRSPFKVIFGLQGMGVAPAGTVKENTGHHHLFINAELSSDMLGYPIPKDDQHMHFGGGQTETMLELAPGSYTLRLVMGDANHIPHSAVVQSDPIRITVVEE